MGHQNGFAQNWSGENLIMFHNESTLPVKVIEYKIPNKFFIAGSNDNSIFAAEKFQSNVLF